MKLGIIGGTGLEHLARGTMKSYLGEREFQIFHSKEGKHELFFVPRHGKNRQNLPTQVPYKSILEELHHLKVKAILAFSCTGALDTETPLASKNCFVVPYDYLRLPGFTPISLTLLENQHANMNPPFDQNLREKILQAGKDLGFEMREGIYAMFPGNAFETRAEIALLRTASLIAQEKGIPNLSLKNMQAGMTSVPEAILAKELNIPYALTCIPSNYGQGLTENPVTIEDIEANLDRAKQNTPKLLDAILERV